MTRPSTPHDAANPWRRWSSARRSGVVATSRLPTWRKHHSPSSVSETSFSTVYRAYSVIDFDGFVWKIRPGACDVEPPAAHSRPCSTTTTFVQPRSVSSSASPVPTIPAPMITTRGDAIVPPVSGSCPLYRPSLGRNRDGRRSPAGRRRSDGGDQGIHVFQVSGCLSIHA